jgi:hypothetical protein
MRAGSMTTLVEAAEVVLMRVMALQSQVREATDLSDGGRFVLPMREYLVLLYHARPPITGQRTLARLPAGPVSNWASRRAHLTRGVRRATDVG